MENFKDEFNGFNEFKVYNTFVNWCKPYDLKLAMGLNYLLPIVSWMDLTFSVAFNLRGEWENIRLALHY